MELIKDITHFIQSLGYNFTPDLTLQKRVWHPVKDEEQKIAYTHDVHELKDKTPVIVFTVYDYKKQKHFTEKFAQRDISERELKKIADIISKQAEKAKEEKEAKWEETRSFCIEKYNEASPVTEHAYLTRKQVLGTHPIRVRTTELGAQLLIPTEDINGKFWSYQVITETGDKHFDVGARTDSVFCRLGDSKDYSRIYLCEGAATALSIGTAIGWKYPVVVAFSANNLPKVAAAFRSKYEKGALVICADNDQWKPENGNPGIEYAERAANSATGAVVAVPSFSSEALSHKPTDFNDVHVLDGIVSLSTQLEAVKIERPSVVYYLGYFKNNHYVTTTEDPQIQVLRELSTTELQNLRPLQWWEQRYGDEGGVIDWPQAKDDIIRASKARGIFEPNKLRGRGVWVERGEVVVHKGDALVFPDGRSVDLQDIESENIYDPRRKAVLPSVSDVLSTTAFNELVSVIRRFPWEHAHHADLFIGWLFVAPIAGCLEWRPHIAISAPAGTGKTTLIDLVVSELLKYGGLVKKEGVTEASLRQNLGSDAIPVVLDEFDTNSMDQRKISTVLSLLRVASSGGEISKGTVSGKAMNFQAKFCALLSGINLPPLVEADRTRITEMELTPHKRTENWQQLEKDIDSICTDKVAAGLFNLQVKRAHLVVESAEVLKHIIGEKFTSRHGQQYGVMLAGFWHLNPVNDKAITREEAKAFVETWSSQEKEANNEKLYAPDTDSDECYSHLMAFPVDKDDAHRAVTLSMVCDDEVAGDILEVKNKSLAQHGMKLTKDGLFVPNAMPTLRKHFNETVWPNWNKSLRRRNGVRQTSLRVGGLVRRGVMLPLVIKSDEF